jgi:hypothetical protein
MLCDHKWGLCISVRTKSCIQILFPLEACRLSGQALFWAFQHHGYGSETFTLAEIGVAG